MSTILFVISLLILWISYSSLKQNITNPAVIMSTVIAIAAVIGACFEDDWGLNLTIQTVILIGTCMFVTYIGNLLAIHWGNKLFSEKEIIIHNRYMLNNWFLVIYGLVMMLLLYHYYNEINALLTYTGNFDAKDTEILLDVREAKLNHEMESSLFLKIGTSLNNCFFIASVYALIYNVIFWGFSYSDFKFMLPIVFYTVTSVLNASRIDFLGPFFYLITLATLFYSYKYYTKPHIVFRGVVIYGGGASIFFLAWFAVLRYFRGGDFDVFDHLARYISGGLYDFNQYYIGGIYPYLSSNTFGAHTFTAIYKFIDDIIGIQLNEIIELSSSTTFVTTTTFGCNIYSAFCPLVEDFGETGTLMVFFFMALLMGLYNVMILKKKNLGMLAIIFAESLGAYYMIPVDEAFFHAHFISLSRLAHFIIVWICITVIIQHKETKCNG